MPKITQRDLLNEGFWDKFDPSPAIKQGYEAIKQVGSVVAPEFADPLRKTINKARGIKAAVIEAGKPWKQRIIDWAIEQGRFPISDIKKIKTYPDGKTHYALKVAEKGIDKNTGDEVAGREYRNSNAVIALNPEDNRYSWIIKPRSDSYRKEKRADGRIYNVFYNDNSNVEGYDEPIDLYQPNHPQTQNQPQNTP